MDARMASGVAAVLVVLAVCATAVAGGVARQSVRLEVAPAVAVGWTQPPGVCRADEDRGARGDGRTQARVLVSPRSYPMKVTAAAEPGSPVEIEWGQSSKCTTSATARITLTDL